MSTRECRSRSRRTTRQLERRLSVYDAASTVLVEALDVPLVTADRRLAEATDKAILV